ncbi:MAG: hypothetical protein HRU33_24350 [Rhodobacteraceae bacterium]|nr:hypothetical protein [Paracoccaceae bacterium]
MFKSINTALISFVLSLAFATSSMAGASDQGKALQANRAMSMEALIPEGLTNPATGMGTDMVAEKGMALKTANVLVVHLLA